MAVDHELEIETDFAKSYIVNCQDIDEDYRKELVNLIEITKLATNGITPEEKIQKITESIAKLALSQVGLIKTIKTMIVNTFKEENKDINNRIISAITTANIKQCENCKAMDHAIQIEKDQEKQDILEQYINKNKDKQYKEQNRNNPKTKFEYIFSILEQILTKPYVWVFGCILAISPHGVEIINAIL